MQCGIIISCSDRRLEDTPVRAREKVRELGYDVGDNQTYRIQIAGPDGDVCGAFGVESQKGVFQKVDRIIALNRATFIVIIGHCDCAGNVASDDEHRDHTKRAAEILYERYSMPVLGFLDCLVESGKWNLKLICHLKADTK